MKKEEDGRGGGGGGLRWGEKEERRCSRRRRRARGVVGGFDRDLEGKRRRWKGALGRRGEEGTSV